MSFDGASPRRPPAGSQGSVSSGSRSWAEWTQQLQAYVAWVNSQLRKKPGTKEVKDLRRELQDGTVLVELIEIVASEKIPGAHYKPTNSLEMKENVERVLQFMRSRKIKMHQIRSTDIVEGNMKSIMRLILALAAHFKPSSVKQSPHQSAKSTRTLGIAQEAASALASIRKDAETIKRKMHRPANLDNATSGPSTSTPHNGAFKPPINRKLGYETSSPRSKSHRPAEGGPPLDVLSSPISSLRSASSKSSLDSESEGDLVDRYSVLLDDVQDSQTVLIEETKQAHHLLIELQNVLLSGQEDSVDESMEINENTTNYEQLVIYQARMQQSEDACTRLREELSRTKQECMQLQGMKQGLHQRLSEQQQEILQMKAKALRADIDDNDEEETEGLRDELTEKTTMLNRMHTELERKSKTISHLESELNAQSNHSQEIIKSLKEEVRELKSSESNSTHTRQRSASDITQPFTEQLDPKILTDPAVSTEIRGAESALQTLKLCIPDSEATTTSLESLEAALVSMVNKLRDVNKQNSKPTAEVKGHHRVFNSKLSQSKADSTKLLCFSSKSVTPSMRTIHKKLGEITLQDYKSIFCPNNSNGEDSGLRKKFLFKSLDAEFGTVKEELTADTDIIPGWEGKVIGWIEDDLQ